MEREKKDLLNSINTRDILQYVFDEHESELRYYMMERCVAKKRGIGSSCNNQVEFSWAVFKSYLDLK